jgi:hypothetical protein
MPFLALSLCECKRSQPSKARTAARTELTRQLLQRARAQPVPSFLTLYTACMPCTASISHAAWDIGIEHGVRGVQHGIPWECLSRIASCH